MRPLDQALSATANAKRTKLLYMLHSYPPPLKYRPVVRGSCQHSVLTQAFWIKMNVRAPPPTLAPARLQLVAPAAAPTS